TNRCTLPLPAGLNSKFLFSVDGSRLLTPCEDGQIRVWRTTDGTLERSAKTAFYEQNAVLFPDGSTAFGVRPDGRGFVLQNLVTGEIKNTPMPLFNISGFCFDSTGERWASTGNVPWSRIWTTRSCEPLTPLLHHEGVVSWVAWSPNGQ